MSKITTTSGTTITVSPLGAACSSDYFTIAGCCTVSFACSCTTFTTSCTTWTPPPSYPISLPEDADPSCEYIYGITVLNQHIDGLRGAIEETEKTGRMPYISYTCCDCSTNVLLDCKYYAQGSKEWKKKQVEIFLFDAKNKLGHLVNLVDSLTQMTKVESMLIDEEK